LDNNWVFVPPPTDVKIQYFAKTSENNFMNRVHMST